MRATDQVTFENMLERNLSTDLLPEESSDCRAWLGSRGMPCDVVGDREEDERMQLDSEAGI